MADDNQNTEFTGVSLQNNLNTPDSNIEHSLNAVNNLNISETNKHELSQTDHINRRLLASFLDRLNQSCVAPAFVPNDKDSQGDGNSSTDFELL